MKRTELKRKTPLKAKTGLKRSAMKRTAPKKTAARKAAKGDTRWRSEKYLAWVRTLPCCVCGATIGVAAHHLIGMWGLSGMGLKAPDSFVMPACDPVYGHSRDCHQQIHADQQLRDRQPEFLKSTLARGVAQFPGEKALTSALAFVESHDA